MFYPYACGPLTRQQQRDPTGYGFHGDFLNGWDVDLLQTAINQCSENIGSIEQCDAFKPYIQIADVQNQCNRTPRSTSRSLACCPRCRAATLSSRALLSRLPIRVTSLPPRPPFPPWSSRLPPCR